MKHTDITHQIIQEGIKLSGTKIVTSSFGIQSAVMLDLLQDAIQQRIVEVVFLDTTTLHPETYEHKKTLCDHFEIPVRTYLPNNTVQNPESLFTDDEAVFHQYYKIEPKNKMLQELQPQVWFSGRRQTQTTDRLDLSMIDRSHEIVRVHPISHWSDAHVLDYMLDRGLPFHPLALQGATRVGQRFETVHRRTECGIHDGGEYQI